MQTGYAHKGQDGIYTDIFSHIVQVRMSEGKTPEPIYKVSIREVHEGENSIYWGWKDKDGRYSMIFRHINLLRVCFQYGLESAEESGNGVRVNLVVEEIE